MKKKLFIIIGIIFIFAIIGLILIIRANKKEDCCPCCSNPYDCIDLCCSCD